MRVVKKFVKILFAFCFSALFLISCEKKEEDVIVFDNSEPLSLAPDIEWAVVKDPYAAYKSEIGWESSVVGHSRKGDILQVKGKSIDSNKEVWYYFENGWLSENCLTIYSNRLKAQSVSQKLLSDDKK